MACLQLGVKNVPEHLRLHTWLQARETNRRSSGMGSDRAESPPAVEVYPDCDGTLERNIPGNGVRSPHRWRCTSGTGRICLSSSCMSKGESTFHKLLSGERARGITKEIGI